MLKSIQRDRISSEEWTFLDFSTKRYTHALHLYPARMHPEIAKRIIEKYAKRRDVVLDPFVGSGGVMLESILHGHDAIGIDINPFAVLLSKVKTTPITRDLKPILDRILSNSSRDHRDGNYYLECAPDKINLNEWYTSDCLNKLTIIKHHIFKIRDVTIRNFFKICLSLTIRRSSYQRNNSWKIHRISEIDRLEFDSDPIQIFADIVQPNITRMHDMVKSMPKGRADIILGDSRDITSIFSRINNDSLPDKKAHLVITSPPYGDHSTTVAYGQFSKHSSLWLELEEERALAVDSIGLGGTKKTGDDLGSDILNDTIHQVYKNDKRLTKNKKPSRADSVYSFFYDLDRCMEQISKNLVPDKSHCCFVVANRTVRRVIIPTDQITVDLAKKYGFRVERIFQRNIPNKSMPLKNAPENIKSETGSTMTQEKVIVMRY